MIIFNTLKVYLGSAYIRFLLALFGSVFSLYIIDILFNMPTDVVSETIEQSTWNIKHLQLICLIGAYLFFYFTQTATCIHCISYSGISAQFYFKYLMLLLFHIGITVLMSGGASILYCFILLLPITGIGLLILQRILVMAIYKLYVYSKSFIVNLN